MTKKYLRIFIILLLFCSSVPLQKVNAITIKSQIGANGSGVYLTNSTSDAYKPGNQGTNATFVDNLGGVIVGMDGTSLGHNYAQRLDSSGNKMWGVDGINLSNGATGTQ